MDEKQIAALFVGVLIGDAFAILRTRKLTARRIKKVQKQNELLVLKNEALLWLATHQHLSVEEIGKEITEREKFINIVAHTK